MMAQMMNLGKCREIGKNEMVFGGITPRFGENEMVFGGRCSRTWEE